MQKFLPAHVHQMYLIFASSDLQCLFVRLGTFLYLKTELEQASETQHYFKMKTMGKVQRQTIASLGHIQPVEPYIVRYFLCVWMKQYYTNAQQSTLLLQSRELEGCTESRVLSVLFH
jgi:hypothetical protein